MIIPNFEKYPKGVQDRLLMYFLVFGICEVEETDDEFILTEPYTNEKQIIKKEDCGG